MAEATSAVAEMPQQEGLRVPPTQAILFPIVCIAVGLACKNLTWTRVPYTALLLLVGLAVGFLQLIPPEGPSTVAFTETLALWLHMDPRLLLQVFLPTIAFTASINLEPHMLRRNWGQIMLLAWPGVVLSFLGISLCAKFFFPYGWDWKESCLFGAMLSATDPVAVLAVLQEVGASPKLASVIDGEALVNDGSALVIFLLLQRTVEGQSLSVAQVVTSFCQLALAGAAIGIAFGLFTSIWLGRIIRDETTTIVLTFVSAYASYYVADELCHASGLLAVVLNGATCSLFGGRAATRRVQHSMHAFWGVLEWLANTILFVWVGVVVAFTIANPPLVQFADNAIYLEWSDAGYAVVLYLWLQVVRVVLMAICWYPFKLTGYPMDLRTAIVFVWAGLRGAVGMTIALFILLDAKIGDAAFKSHCIFYMGTMAFATVLINGGTTKALLRHLGFTSHTPEQFTVLCHIVRDIDRIEKEHLSSLEPHDLLGDPDWDAVRAWTNLHTDWLLASVSKNVREAQVNVAASLPVTQRDCERPSDAQLQLLYDSRLRMLNILKAHYANALNEHSLGVGVAGALDAACDMAIDAAALGLTDWRHLQQHCGLPWWARAAKVFEGSRFKPLALLADAAVYRSLLDSLIMVASFVEAHAHAQELMHKQIGGDSSHASTSDSVTGRHAAGVPISEGSSDWCATAAGLAAAVRTVLQESRDEVAAAKAYAQQLVVPHPSLPAWLRSRYEALKLISKQDAFVQRIAEAGLVEQREVKSLQELLLAAFRRVLQSNSMSSAALHFAGNRARAEDLPLFDSLEPAELEALMAASQWHFFMPGAQLGCIGDAITHVVVIARGTATLHFRDASTAAGASRQLHTVIASVGDPLGVAELMTGVPRQADVFVQELLHGLVVPAQAFQRLVAQNAKVAKRAWQATAARQAAQYDSILGAHSQLVPLNMHARSCNVVFVQKGQEVVVWHTAVLMQGQVRAAQMASAPNAAAGMLFIAPCELTKGTYVGSGLPSEDKGSAGTAPATAHNTFSSSSAAATSPPAVLLVVPKHIQRQPRHVMTPSKRGSGGLSPHCMDANGSTSAFESDRALGRATWAPDLDLQPLLRPLARHTDTGFNYSVCIVAAMRNQVSSVDQQVGSAHQLNVDGQNGREG